MTVFALAAIAPGRDGPGVLAVLSAILKGSGCNIEDIFSKPLSGHCAAMLTAQSPMGLPPADFLAALEEQLGELGWEHAVWTLVPALPRGNHGTVFVAGFTGPDREGIVSAITEFLAGNSVNILSFDCDLTNRRSTYVARIRAALPPLDDDSMRAEVTRRVELELGIAQLAEDLGLEGGLSWE